MCLQGILDYLVSGPKLTPGLARTSLDFPGRLLFFVETITDKVILDHKKLYLVYFENFHFFVIFSLVANFCLKSLKKRIFKINQI